MLELYEVICIVDNGVDVFKSKNYVFANTSVDSEMFVSSMWNKQYDTCAKILSSKSVLAKEGKIL